MYLIDSEEDVVRGLVVHCALRTLGAANEDAALRKARSALNFLVSRGLHHEIRDGQRYFDMFEATQMLAQLGPDGDAEHWWGGVVDSYRCRVETLEAAMQAVDAGREEAHRRFDVRLRRTVSASQWRPGARVRFGLLLPAEEPTQRDIEIHDARVTDGFQIVRDRHCLDIRGVANADLKSVEIFVHLSVTVLPHRPEARETRDFDVTPWLASDDGVVRITDSLRELSNRIAPPAVPPIEAVRMFWRYMFSHVRVSFVHYDTLNPDAPLESVLAQGWADCRLASCCLIALCRARGIPARLVGGYQLHAVAPAEHWWCEIHLPGDGWAPFDFASWVLAGGQLSDAWSNRWFGALEPRLIVHRLPYRVPMSLGVRLPAHFHTRQALHPDAAVVVSYLDAHTGSLLYSDHVRVCMAGAGEQAST